MSFRISKVMFYIIPYDPAIQEACPAVFEESDQDYVKPSISSMVPLVCDTL